MWCYCFFGFICYANCQKRSNVICLTCENIQPWWGGGHEGAIVVVSSFEFLFQSMCTVLLTANACQEPLKCFWRRLLRLWLLNESQRKSAQHLQQQQHTLKLWLSVYSRYIERHTPPLCGNAAKQDWARSPGTAIITDTEKLKESYQAYSLADISVPGAALCLV